MKDKFYHLKHYYDYIISIFLFLFFLLFALTVLSLGANVYQNTVSHADDHYTERVITSYITNKIRAFNENGKIDIISFHDVPAIALYETIDDTDFVTYLYEYDHMLCELTTRIDNELPLNAGQPIIAIDRLKPCLSSDNLLLINLTTSFDKEITLYLALHNSY